MLGPFATASRRTPIYQVSLLSPPHRCPRQRQRQRVTEDRIEWVQQIERMEFERKQYRTATAVQTVYIWHQQQPSVQSRSSACRHSRQLVAISSPVIAFPVASSHQSWTHAAAAGRDVTAPTERRRLRAPYTVKMPVHVRGRIQDTTGPISP